MDAKTFGIHGSDAEYLYYIYLYLYISPLHIFIVTGFAVFFLQFISIAGYADIYLLLVYCLYSYLIDFADARVVFFSEFVYADHVDLYPYSSPAERRSTERRWVQRGHQVDNR